jgi:hypothetical protein
VVSHLLPRPQASADIEVLVEASNTTSKRHTNRLEFAMSGWGVGGYTDTKNKASLRDLVNCCGVMRKHDWVA